MKEKILGTIEKYEMFKPGDKVLIALSGGKDSLALVHMLGELRDEGRIAVSLGAVNVSTDAVCGVGIFQDLLRGFCSDRNIPVDRIYFPIIEDAGEQLSCFYCAMRRRAAMFEYASKRGYSVLAFGHHLDDMAETVIMNMVFNGNISTMSPTVEIFDGELRLVRPLADVREYETAALVQELKLQTAVCSCPFSSMNIRGTIKEYLTDREGEIAGVRENIVNAISQLA